MGLFSMFKNKIEEQKEKQRLWAERKAKEAEDDAKRPSTTTIPFFKLEESMPNIIALKDKKIDKKYEDDIDRYYRYYVKIADLNGTVYRELVLTTKRDLVKAWKKNVDWLQAENPDVVTNTDYPRVYVLHYYLGEEEFYLALDKAEFDNIASVAGKIRFKTNQGMKCLELNRYESYCCFW